MRNNFDHFDERLEWWWAQFQQPRGYMDLCIGSDSNLQLFSPADDRFRVLDPEVMVLTFWGQAFHLDQLIGEVKRILPRVRAECVGGPWR